MPKPTPVPGRDDAAAEAAQKRRGMNGAAVETVAPKGRRQFPASEKLRILKDAAAALASSKRGALEALLRKEGIYSSHLSAWRLQLGAHGAAGLAPRRPGRKPKVDEKDRALLAAEKKVAVLERKLLIANALIDLQKKAHELLGIALPNPDEAS